MMVGGQPVGSGARPKRFEQQHLQIAAMDRELRMLIARDTAERLPIDQLAETIEEGRVLSGDRDLRQIGLQPERGKFFGGMREEIDTDADRLDFGSGFKDPARNSGAVQ